MIDAGSVGEDGLMAFRNIMDEAARHKHHCAGVLLLSENQASWSGRLIPNPRLATLVRPVTLRQLFDKVCELLNQ